MEVAVERMVALRSGEAAVSLALLVQPNGGGAAHRAAPPTRNPEMVSGWEIHPSRQPITRDSMTQAMVTVQKQLHLPTGLRTGGLSDAAMDRLRIHLAKPK